MASTYLTAGTMGSTTSRKKFTISFWIKRGALGEEYMFFGYNASSLANYKLQIGFVNDDTLEIRGVDGGTQHTRLVTNRKFRDPNAWSHFYFAFDSTQGTASDRIKIYINGEQETSLSTSTYPNQNTDFAVGVDGGINYTLKIGTWGSGGNYFSGSMSHFYYVDGSVIAHTQFGSTDATTGEWKISTSPTIASYGNEGFLVLKDGNTVTDQSPNSNNLTVGGGTLTKTEDCPSNVFATMNPLNHDYANTDSQLLNGNTYVNPQVNGSHNYAVSTLGMPKGNGKFYAEAKLVQYDNSHMAVGIVDMDYVSELFYENRNIVSEGDVTYLGRVVYTRYGYVITGGGTETQGFGATYTNGDILQIACDMENGAIYFGKNGTWQNSGDPTSGSSRTGAVNTSAASWWTGTSNWGFWCGDKSTTGLDKFAWNFGNGYFQSTAVSSAGTNASGNGIFEYDVPSGYTALSTKGLNL